MKSLEPLKATAKETPIPLALLMVLALTLAYGAILTLVRLP